ncbi:MAG: DUF885 family protein [Pseudomonadales bacterium]
MKAGLSLGILLLLTACASDPIGTAVAPENQLRRFETAIARSYLQETREQLAQLKGSIRATFLRHQASRFAKAVDRQFLSSSARQEAALLDYLVSSEEVRWFGSDYETRVRAMSSLDWPLARYATAVAAEIERIDQTIAALQPDDPLNGFSLANHIRAVRDTASYPADSPAGRQQYLDNLAETMLAAQLDWNDIFTDYEASALRLIGSDSADYSFRHAGDALHINLASVRDLPDFEYQSIAWFYGFPGLQAFQSGSTTDSLRSQLVLPSYTVGWALFIVDYLGTRTPDTGNRQLYFMKLIIGLALADLNVNSGSWDIDSAVDYLQQETPYARTRIQLMLNRVVTEPGYYLAGVGGYIYFSALHDACLRQRQPCEADLFQQIVDSGPVPFAMLDQRLRSTGLIPAQ